jgi:hypothetical protein
MQKKINEVRFSQEAGFQFAEMSICPYLDLSLVKSKISREGKRSLYYLESPSNSTFKSHCCPVKNLDSSIKSLIIDISKNTFKTDRFHMDPICKKSIADARIGLWVELDLLKENANYCSYL